LTVVLQLPKKTLYAIESVLDIAYHAGGETVQSREITRRQGIPRRYLEQALQQLVRHGILVGLRGPRGGYRLARERRRITVGDIVRVVGANDTVDEGEENGSELGRKVVRPLWTELQSELMARLDGITIDELCNRADAAGVISEGRQHLDFSI
jgi:Rrf2 family iron-sulfur cluster assembly transcriptional regulator